MKKIILDPDDKFRVITGNSLSLEITIEQAFRFLASRKKIDNSNIEYCIKQKALAPVASSVATPKDVTEEDNNDK